MKTVAFKNKTWNVVANLHWPSSFDESKTYPAIVVAQAASDGCQEEARRNPIQIFPFSRAISRRASSARGPGQNRYRK